MPAVYTYEKELEKRTYISSGREEVRMIATLLEIHHNVEQGHIV